MIEHYATGNIHKAQNFKFDTNDNKKAKVAPTCEECKTQYRIVKLLGATKHFSVCTLIEFKTR